MRCIWGASSPHIDCGFARSCLLKYLGNQRRLLRLAFAGGSFLARWQGKLTLARDDPLPRAIVVRRRRIGRVIAAVCLRCWRYGR